MSSRPVIIPRSNHPVSRKWISPNALRVLYRLRENGHLAYLVGGGVRDLILGREPKDFDIATDARPNEVKKIFRNCRLIGRRFRLAHVHFHGEIIEVATFRSNAPGEPQPVETAAAPEQPLSPVEAQESVVAAAEQPPSPGAERPKPPRMLKTDDGMILRDNVFGTPEDDAIRRDFTVNALFYSVADFSVIDYVGGMADLQAGLIRLIGDPRVRFTEDPVRMVRAVRFAAALGFEIEQETYAALLELRDKVSLASNARMYEEVQKLFLLGEGEKVFQLLRKTGLFGVLFPRINEWLETEDGGFPHIRVGKALEWVDACVQAGKTVQPHILFGLMFGQYIEEAWKRNEAAGMHSLDGLDRAVADFLAEETPRILIPRKVGLAIRDMLWNQMRFEKRQGKHPHFFARRPAFRDAFEYLRFTSEISGERMDLRMWWKEFLRDKILELETGAGPALPQAGERPQGRDKPRRRRRRRRPGPGREAAKL